MDCSELKFRRGDIGTIEEEGDSPYIFWDYTKRKHMAFDYEIELLSNAPSPRLASDMTIREEMRYDIAKEIYGDVINEDLPHKKQVCAIVGVSEDEYQAEIHFPIYCAKRTILFADALINALNEKP